MARCQALLQPASPRCAHLRRGSNPKGRRATRSLQLAGSEGRARRDPIQAVRTVQDSLCSFGRGQGSAGPAGFQATDPDGERVQPS